MKQWYNRGDKKTASRRCNAQATSIGVYASMSPIIPANPGIYKIICIANDRFYIGSSVNLDSRWKDHLRKLKNGNHRNVHLQRAYQKYGGDNFTFEVIEFCEKSVLIQREQYYLDTLQPEFNIALHAHTPARTPEVIDRISKSHQGIKPNDDTRAKMSAAKTGRTLSVKTRAKMSRARMGNKNSLGSRHNLGRKHTPEHNEKVAATKKKNYIVVSPEGIEIEVFGLAGFCREHNLNNSHMIQVALGNKAAHKGWKCRYDE